MSYMDFRKSSHKITLLIINRSLNFLLNNVNSIRDNLNSGRHDERKELSPGPRDRSKMSSGSSSDKEVPLPPLIPRENCDEGAKMKPMLEKDSDYHNEKSPYGDKMDGGIAGYVPAQRLEWKRYKQYTRNDIMAAIEEVRKGKCVNYSSVLLLKTDASLMCVELWSYYSIKFWIILLGFEHFYLTQPHISL